MHEYMLLVRNTRDHDAAWPVEQVVAFLQACQAYIAQLTQAGQLVSAQPLVREGVMLSGTPGQWEARPLDASGEIIVGYYHIRAESMSEAIAVAQGNPEFSFGTTARIEVRPIRTHEERTAYVYPSAVASDTP